MADDEDQRDERTSDMPVDLSRERENFVRHFLRKGVELTETLLEENKQQAAQLAAAQRDIARLRAQVASDDAIRDLIRKIETLERERRDLLDRSTELEQSSREKEHRNVEVEQELHDLANLYIASSHLHSTLSVRGVMRHLKELMQQLVGAEAFVIYLVYEAGGPAQPVACDGYEEGELAPIALGEGVIGEVLMTGVPRVSNAGGRGTLEAPIAVIPLMVRDQALGAIAITSIFEQKPEWAPVDHELFKLLGSHAATALIAANLYAGTSDAFDALSGIAEHLSPPISP